MRPALPLIAGLLCAQLLAAAECRDDGFLISTFGEDEAGEIYVVKSKQIKRVRLD